MMERRGRPVWGGVFGFLFGVFLVVDLLFFGAFRLESAMVLILPLITLLVGAVVGFFGPLRIPMGRRG